MYTIEVIKWDKHLLAKSHVYQTVNRHECDVMSKKIEEVCKSAMRSGNIVDYRITRYDNSTAYIN